MKKIIVIFALAISHCIFAQEHFAGLTTSARGGLISAAMNPAELMNINNRFEFNISGVSINFSNNKVGFSDITSNKNLEDLLFQGNDPVSMKVSFEALGPGFGVKIKKWAFGLTTKASGYLDVANVDPNLGKALFNNSLNTTSVLLNSTDNQRLSGIVWGEVGFTAATSLIDNEKRKLSIGATFKLLFPGAYSNIGLQNSTGTISQVGNNLYLNNASASLNIAYSGSLANGFSTFNDYSKSVFGNLNGFVGDLGVNYQIKSFDDKDSDKKSDKYKNKYKLNAGISFKNIGNMTFKDENNYNTDYSLNIQSTIQNPNGLNLNQFENIDNPKEIETILANNGYLNIPLPIKNAITVQLPTTFSAYVDVKLVPKVYLSGFIQQKFNNGQNNNQMAAANIITVTPRLNLGFFEIYSPWTRNEVSGTNGGLGFRLGGFYLGSSSIATALINDSKQVDLYTGFRWAFL
jgi:hypothetical protein